MRCSFTLGQGRIPRSRGFHRLQCRRKVWKQLVLLWLRCPSARSHQKILQHERHILGILRQNISKWSNNRAQFHHGHMLLEQWTIQRRCMHLCIESHLLLFYNASRTHCTTLLHYGLYIFFTIHVTFTENHPNYSSVSQAAPSFEDSASLVASPSYTRVSISPHLSHPDFPSLLDSTLQHSFASPQNQNTAPHPFAVLQAPSSSWASTHHISLALPSPALVPHSPHLLLPFQSCHPHASSPNTTTRAPKNNNVPLVFVPHTSSSNSTLNVDSTLAFRVHSRILPTN
mmetsp:Transcript_13275/g.26460  ORF Transcript_13275/g.26460 Transcript_13275/m.26460 type:complete len:286 (+) Transcript_13275:1586-2443(+)